MSMLVNEFLNHARALGLEFDGDILCDGQLHRIHVKGDKRGKKNGWYIYHDEIIPVCVFGTWKGGQKHVWSARHESELNKKERDDLKRKLAEASRIARRKRKQEQRLAAYEAGKIYSESYPASCHEYLDKKLIGSNPVLRKTFDGELLIPVVDQNGELSSLQYIYPNGRKKFHPGGKITGCFCPIEGTGEVIYICEGYATGATINEALGNMVYVAFNCNNLESVARFAQNKHQHNLIVIAGDDDFMTKEPVNNPGRVHAEKAAQALGLMCVYPEFNAYHRKSNHTDFNDMHHEGVTQCINNYVADCINKQVDNVFGVQLT